MQTYKLKKYKLLIIFTAITILSTIFWVYYGPNSASKYKHISSEIDKVTSEIETLKIQNKAMNDEITKLKNDKQYFEDVARKEYGLLKKNEMVFEFKNSKH